MGLSGAVQTDGLEMNFQCGHFITLVRRQSTPRHAHPISRPELGPKREKHL